MSNQPTERQTTQPVGLLNKHRIMIEELRGWGPTLDSAAAVMRFALERTHSQLVGGDKFAVVSSAPVSAATAEPTEAEVSARRLKRAMGGKSHDAVGKLAGVHKSAVTHVLSGKNPLAGKLLAWVEGQEKEGVTT